MGQILFLRIGFIGLALNLIRLALAGLVSSYYIR